MAMNADRTVKQLESNLRKWCTAQARPLGEREAQRTLEAVKAANPWRALGPLDLYAMFLAGQGAVRVLDGDEGGWHLLEDSLIAQTWSLKLAYGRYARRRDAGEPQGIVNEPNVPARLFAHALAIESREAASWLAGAIISSVDNGAFGRWMLNAFEAYAIDLCRLSQGHKPQAPPEAGPYLHILETWNEPDRFGEAIAECCDYHLTKVKQQEGFADFITQPYGLFPIEILATFQLRRASKLEVPRVIHPLLAIQLAHPPMASAGVTPRDPICRSATDLIRQSLGD